MTTNNRIIENRHALDQLFKFLEARDMPFTVTITDGKHRTSSQNRLQRQWVMEIAAQTGDMPEEVRGYCKLHFGVPILRNESDAFRKEYDEVVRPLPYPLKLKLMMVPFDFGVTRIMTTRQKKAYLDNVFRHYSEQGLILTDPEELRLGSRRAA